MTKKGITAFTIEQAKRNCLKLFDYSPAQKEVMHQLCVRLNRLYKAYSEEAVRVMLASLGKLDRPYLTAIEEKLLSVLEDEGGLTGNQHKSF